MKEVFSIVLVAIFTLLAATANINAQGYGPTSMPANTSQANITTNETNVTITQINASQGNVTNKTIVSSSTQQLNVTSNATNATAPYSAPGFEGFFAIAGLISAVCIALKMKMRR